ncbi:hypothetical protein CRYUN_Cryun36dG0102400 [Craigia yunnanensis]
MKIESIGSLEIQGQCGTLQRKQVILVDNDGVNRRFLLWNEQVILANLFSVGSMLALDRPYITSSAESGIETSDEFCIEYGTATQLYIVPFVQHEEQLDSFELSWFEKDTGASFINLSCLPALVNSSCLHKLSCLSDLSSRRISMHVWIADE